jgi:hypothetical protein
MLEAPLLVPLGIVILVILAIDLFRTVAQSSEGRLARITQASIQKILIFLYKITGKRAFLSWTSSMLILGLLTMWIALLYLGWFLIYLSSDESILRGKDEVPATVAEKLYFTGFSISTLGVGDYIPNGKVWQIVTVLCSISGFFLLTFIISFIVSVIEKQALRRRLALHIHYLGKSPQDIITKYWQPDENIVLDHALDSILDDLIEFAQQQLDQPILNRFHGPSKGRSIERALVVIDETLTMAIFAVDSDLPPASVQAQQAITDYLDSLQEIEVADVDTAPPIPDFTPLREADIPLYDDDVIQSHYERLTNRREKLQALIQSTGWTWQEITIKQGEA